MHAQLHAATMSTLFVSMAGMETVSAAHTLQMYWVISKMTLASMSMQILVVLLSPAILLTLTQTAMPTTAVKIRAEWLLMAHALHALVVQERENHRAVQRKRK